jgi:hypothetical protein
MTRDYWLIPRIAEAAIGKIGDQPTFAFPEVLEVIALCTTNGVAVLGAEVHRVRADGYYTEELSEYSYDRELQRELDAKLQMHGWPEYVSASNALAAKFISSCPKGDDHVYLLSACNWREFCENQKIKRQ